MSKTTAKSVSINLKGVRAFFGRFGSILYLISVAIALAVALLLVMQLINSDQTPSDADSSLTNFDQETIKLLREDESTSQGSSVRLPGGRINPFE